MAMMLGEETLTYYPSAFTPPRPQRSNSHLETYGGIAHFSWGFSIFGAIIELIWDYMPSEQFDILDGVFQLDEEVVWDPDIPGLGVSYNVQILDFTGEFHLAVGVGTEIWRKNCKMTLLIMGENEGGS